MDEIKKNIMCISLHKEVLDLWFEVTFMRALLSYITKGQEIPSIVIEDARKYAKSELHRKFGLTEKDYDIKE